VIHDANSGEVLGSGVTAGDSGNLYGSQPAKNPASALDKKAPAARSPTSTASFPRPEVSAFLL
jgi:hypothetical protein